MTVLVLIVWRLAVFGVVCSRLGAGKPRPFCRDLYLDFACLDHGGAPLETRHTLDIRRITSAHRRKTSVRATSMQATWRRSG